jgi:hypothetical protein
VAVDAGAGTARIGVGRPVRVIFSAAELSAHRKSGVRSIVPCRRREIDLTPLFLAEPQPGRTNSLSCPARVERSQDCSLTARAEASRQLRKRDPDRSPDQDSLSSPPGERARRRWTPVCGLPRAASYVCGDGFGVQGPAICLVISRGSARPHPAAVSGVLQREEQDDPDRSPDPARGFLLLRAFGDRNRVVECLATADAAHVHPLAG